LSFLGSLFGVLGKNRWEMVFLDLKNPSPIFSPPHAKIFYFKKYL
jgi:hypothetical protein